MIADRLVKKQIRSILKNLDIALELTKKVDDPEELKKIALTALEEYKSFAELVFKKI